MGYSIISIGGGLRTSLYENQGSQHILEWQDTVKGVCGGSYQVSLGGNTDKYCFASRQEDYQSYGLDDQSLIMSKRNYQIPLTGGAEIRNGWMLG